MPIYYSILQRKNPIKPLDPPMYYLQAKSINKIGREYLLEDMVRNTSLTQSEAATAFDYLLERVPRLMELGFTVQLGKLGYFRAIINCEGSETEEEATVNKIKKIRPTFVCGEQLRKQINDCKLEKFNRL